MSGEQILVRHARRDGRPVAVLRALDRDGSCVVEAEVFPAGAAVPIAVRPGPYAFADARGATEFVAEAVEALTVLGCDVREE